MCQGSKSTRNRKVTSTRCSKETSTDFGTSAPLESRRFGPDTVISVKEIMAAIRARSTGAALDRIVEECRPKHSHGPYRLVDIEEIAGDFTEALMRPVVSPLVSPGNLQLTTIGYRWPCGCETRGTATPADVPACVWAACAKHEHLREPMPARPDQLGFEDIDPVVVPRSLATMRPGQILVLHAPLEIDDCMTDLQLAAFVGKAGVFHLADGSQLTGVLAPAVDGRYRMAKQLGAAESDVGVRFFTADEVTKIIPLP